MILRGASRLFRLGHLVDRGERTRCPAGKRRRARRAAARRRRRPGTASRAAAVEELAHARDRGFAEIRVGSEGAAFLLGVAPRDFGVARRHDAFEGSLEETPRRSVSRRGGASPEPSPEALRGLADGETFGRS